jgi:hypothetical protein
MFCGGLPQPIIAADFMQTIPSAAGLIPELLL